MENVTVTEEEMSEREDQQRKDNQELAEKQQSASKRVANIIEKTSHRNRFTAPEEETEQEAAEETGEDDSESGEEEQDENEDTETTSGEEDENEQTTDADTEQTGEEDDQTGAAEAEIPDQIKAPLDEAFPEQETETPEQVQEQIAGLIEDSENLAEEREANQKVYEIFENSEEMVQLARKMDQGHGFLESLALTVDLEQTLSGLEEDDPEKYKEVMKAQAKREAERERQQKEQEKRQEEFEKNEEASQEIIAEFQSDKEISDEEKDEFLGTINNYFENLVKGKITPEFLEVAWKGLNFESELEKAKEQARIEGKNEKIEAEKTKKSGDNLPDINTGKSKDNDDPDASRGKKALASIVKNNNSTFS